MLRRLWLVLVCWPLLAWSDTMRCEKTDGTSGLVSDGDGKYRVLEVCGEPSAREHAGVLTQGVGWGRYFQQVSIPLENWYYQCGYGRFDKVLRFQGDRLARIDGGGLGKQGAPRCF